MPGPINSYANAVSAYNQVARGAAPSARRCGSARRARSSPSPRSTTAPISIQVVTVRDKVIEAYREVIRMPM